MSVATQQLTAQSLLPPPNAVPPARPRTADTRAKITCAMLTAAEADLLQQPSRRSAMVNAGACMHPSDGVAVCVVGGPALYRLADREPCPPSLSCLSVRQA